MIRASVSGPFVDDGDRAGRIFDAIAPLVRQADRRAAEEDAAMGRTPIGPGGGGREGVDGGAVLLCSFDGDDPPRGARLIRRF